LVTVGYSNLGEEWAQKNAFDRRDLDRNTSVRVLLYDDDVDELDDTSDVGDITTEPTDGNYERKSIDLDSDDFSLTVEDGLLRVEGEVTFDVADTTGTINATAVVSDFQSTIVNDETEAEEHLLFSSTLDIGSQDLEAFTSLTAFPRLDLD